MGRGKIPMELIPKEKARKTKYQKRKNGLMKKVYEFATLCGVDVCTIIYAPNFDGQGIAEPETWPQDPREVHRIIQKYHNTTIDRRPKIYDVQEYFKDRLKKVEAEISKVRNERLKIMDPTRDDSFNALGEEQLRIFVGMLDAKFDACSQRLNMQKRDPKGKAAVESDKAETLRAYLVSYPSAHLNLMENMPQPQLFAPPLSMKSVSDVIQLPFCPSQIGQISQPSRLQFGQNYTQLMGKNELVDWANQAGVVTYDPKTGMLNQDGTENNQNSSPFNYNGNMQIMQPHTIALQTLPSQNSQYETAFQSQSDLPHGYRLNYDTTMFEAHMLNYMHGNK